MIPSKNDTNPNQKIKIRLTSDNKCIIKSTIDSADKSKGTINKSEYSINIPDLKDINDNELLTLSKSLTNNQNYDNDDNSNLLISFSNISELNKTRDRDIPSMVGGGEKFKNQNFKENKENIDINNIKKLDNKGSFDSFSNYNNDNNNLSDANDIVNINFNDKSKRSDKSNKHNKSNKCYNTKDKSKENSNIINFKKNINKKNISNSNNMICNAKVFKNIKTVNTDRLNIIHKVENKESKDKNDIVPNHYTNITFGGNNISTNTNNNNYNDIIKNDDYASPTFNIKVNFNSTDLNKNNFSENNNSTTKNESRNKNKNNNTIKNNLNTETNSIKNNNPNNTSKFKKIQLSIKNTNKKVNIKKTNLSSSNLLIKNKNRNQTSLDNKPLNNIIEYKDKQNAHSYLNSNKIFNTNLLSRLYNREKTMTSHFSKSNLISASSQKNLLDKKNIRIKSNSNSNRGSRNLINTSKVLLKKNKSSINIKCKEKKLSNKNMTKKIRLFNKDKNNKDINTSNTSSTHSKNKDIKNVLGKSPVQNINKFNLLSKKIKTQRISPTHFLDKKEKKEKMKERIAKTSLNSYRNLSQDENESIKPKKKSSIIYNRKRNINERYKKIYNNSSNNSSKDSSKIFPSIINHSLQSIDKNNKVLNRKNIFINSNNNMAVSKLNQDKKNLVYNKGNKNFVAIQNFSRYKKKSVLFYKSKNIESNANNNYYPNS